VVWHLKTFLFFCLFSATISKPVLVDKVQLHLNIPGCNVQKLVLLGDKHTTGPCLFEKQQLSTLTKIAIRKNQEDISRLILSEDSCMPQPFEKAIDLSEKLPTCHNIKTENAEIRSVANAAMFAFLTQCPHIIKSTLESKTADKTCRIGSITFGDLEKEFVYHKNSVITWLAEHGEPYITATQPLLTRLMIRHEQFKRALALPDFQIAENDFILQTSQRMFRSQEEEKREAIGNRILDIYASLFDLHLLTRIWSAKQTHVTLLAGDAHTSTICSLLLYDMQQTNLKEVLISLFKIPVQKNHNNIIFSILNKILDYLSKFKLKRNKLIQAKYAENGLQNADLDIA
jgi:hypothetical protein